MKNETLSAEQINQVVLTSLLFKEEPATYQFPLVCWLATDKRGNLNEILVNFEKKVVQVVDFTFPTLDYRTLMGIYNDFEIQDCFSPENDHNLNKDC